MRYGIVKPREMTAQIEEHSDQRLAYKAAGLKHTEVDHGFISPKLAIVIYEYSLFIDAREQHYFSIGRQLFGGPSVLYAVDEHGYTTNLEELPDVTYYLSANAVEQAIADGHIIRPHIMVNDTVLWKWPEPSSVNRTSTG